MAPADGDADVRWFYPKYPEAADALEVRVAVTVDGEQVASRTLRRQWMSAGVTYQAVRPASAGIHAELYLPPPGRASRTPVLLFGGSDGGSRQKFTAGLLASHGHPAMSLAYFRAPGLPQTLTDILLEYFADRPVPDPPARPTTGPGRRRQLLARHRSGAPARPPLPQPDPRPCAVRTQRHHRAVVPRTERLRLEQRWPPCPGRRRRRRQPLVRPHATGTHLAKNLHATAARASVEVIAFPEAGHGVGTYPFQPAGVMGAHPVSAVIFHYGGNRTANAAARCDSWPKAVALLAALP